MPTRIANVIRTVLDNGLAVLVQSVPGVGAAAVHAFIKAGAMLDGDRSGTARFVGSTLMHGTRRRSAQRLAEDLDAMGAALGVAPGLEVTTATGRALADDLQALLRAAAEVVTEPAYPPQEVERVRGQRVTAARINALDTRH
ncbi:MAG: insulinase family protein, partial [bacterium]